ncbi:hypothetical protein N8I77_010569 [Diaporthe amygdali]|uniref:RanBP2-type domain-containing protein n=1 Tax=Phomopsis amygdali TaxID=1214568 RepID=A0AAD9S770_PHOAM|nr:hypothetical protein N8I77_010569 [Diaporthe amygdali]
MASNTSNDKDAEISKFFVNEDRSQGVDAFEAADLDIPNTARPDNISPLAYTFAEQEEGKGSSSRRFVPTPRTERRFTPTLRPESKSEMKTSSEPQKIPRNEWLCCQCGVPNPLVGPACWQCKVHRACHNCSAA